jgi:hypothetical protein|tara:strand:- start:1369 stop:2493 length:1125 start_codon:yes stop_codon:yes gene_type:complete
MKNFMGKDGFQWFVGVVEDRADPKTLGRVRVRCLGYHTEDLVKLPTSDLPWAHPMNPITSATVSGIGQTPLGVVEGTWVVGFFTDGIDAQQPCIIGTLPGVPAELPTKDSTKGFQDTLNGNYPKYIETDVNRLAVNEKEEGEEINPHSSLTIRRADRNLAIGIAQIDGIYSGVAQIPTDLDVTSWDEPITPYAAAYPRNHVYETEGGHIKEFDDTPTHERIHERHTSGSGYEIGPDGSKVTRVKKDNYTIITEDDYLHIQGTGRHTIDEGLRIRVNSKGESDNNYNIEVGQGSNVNIEVNGGNINLTTLGSGQAAAGQTSAGDININAARNLNMNVGKDFNVNVIGKAVEEIGLTKDEFVVGNNKKTGKKIDLN